MKKTVFVGDGLTNGYPGVSYFRFLPKDAGLIRCGRNGDTLLKSMERMNRMLVEDEYQDVERYVLQLGLGDALLPTLRLHSKWWRVFVDLKATYLGCVPCLSIEQFRERYERLLVKLRANKKAIAVIGLPYVENRTLTLGDTVGRYNAEIKELCSKYKVPFLDLYELEKKELGKQQGSYFVGKTGMGMVLDSLFTSVLPFSNAVSKVRGLSVTVDGIHMNYRMAKKVAKMVELKLIE